MRVLVTGGLGYIGSVAVHRLVTEGHDVVVLDDASTGHLVNLHTTARLVRGSLLDPQAVDTAVAGVDAVMHFAAKSIVSESVAQPELYRGVNTGGSSLLFDSMERHGVHRIVLSSTAAVYGAAEHSPITEQTPCRPVNPYGISKLAVEHDLALRPFAAIALRYFNVAGAVRIGTGWLAERHHPETHLIPNLLNATVGNPATVFGTDWPTRDGSAERDYIHVADLVDAHLAGLGVIGDRPSFDVVNIGGGVGSTVFEVLDTVSSALGRPVPVVYGERREGDPVSLVASIVRAGELLGWAPRRSLHDIVTDVVRSRS